MWSQDFFYNPRRRDSTIWIQALLFHFRWQIRELERTYKELGEASLSKEFCQVLATSLRWSPLLENLDVALIELECLFF